MMQDTLTKRRFQKIQTKHQQNTTIQVVENTGAPGSINAENLALSLDCWKRIVRINLSNPETNTIHCAN